MSTILEALKKSEQERKLNKIPTLNDLPTPKEPSKWPLILGILMSLLALAVIVFYVFFWSKGTTRLVEQANIKPSTSTQQPVVSSEQTQTEINDDNVVVNVISYSTQAEQRFAMVNGKMVREGEFVRAGLQVEKILNDTVIMNLRGKQISRRP